MVPEKSEDLPLCFNLSFNSFRKMISSAYRYRYHLSLGYILRKNEVRTTSATARPTQEEALFYPVAIPR